MKVAEIALRFRFCGTELAGLEGLLARQPGVRAVAMDRTRSVAHVEYDPSATGPQRWNPGYITAVTVATARTARNRAANPAILPQDR